ncbi:formate dehydrogenase accessory sulfurtransferase FdhD, partial [Akkermansiaceae bacterium]|nr:formate dehydrogenase accessory sulfurtransferase FdhD [Akkermansiaceae bacterium]
MPKSSLACQITRWSERKETPLDDIVAVEEPLQVVVDGRPLAVLMRTPGDDELLVMGFLLTEGIIERMTQVRRIDIEARDNHAMVFLIDDHKCDWERLTRHLFSASSCGLCGKATVDAILQNHPPIGQKPEFDPLVIQTAPDTMRAAQANFDSTGGIHASGIFSQEGKLLILREDIGRHNALDKAIGEGLIKEIDFTH